MTPPSNAGGEGREVLAPCPFCGGEATVRTYQTESLWSHDVVTYTQVGCEECDYQRATEPGYDPEALVWWNTRPARENADDRAPALVEAAVAEAITAAIGKADEDFGYRFNLTRMVDGEETHTLFMNGFEPVEFDDRDDGYRLIAERRNKARADAVLAAIRALPTPSQEASNVG